ncbi:hypothetical protein HRI_004898100 [Hibiscus trionum]|uniref:Endonuclease/exonuclease/phosphatase domain-containing protein n=1 Tax=Hibiscus trionum TaxID=183268 RepID=A0A9W7JF86_HIBTR|nr:hypothetical protein HRI_004898100 [Hibiscus trionum]
MEVDILTWNIRGFRRREKRRALKIMLHKFNPSIVFIQEMKVEKISEIEIKRLWHKSNLEFAFSPARGSAGGLLSIWNSELIQVTNKIINHNYIAIIGICKKSGDSCGVVNVYGPSQDSEKGIFLADLLAVIKSKDIPWCIGGDFNLILDSEEKRGFRLIVP